MRYDLPAHKIEKFWSYVSKTEDCWLWIGGLDNHGYGQFSLEVGKPRKAHRVAWSLTGLELIEGLTLDHLCRVRNCVNPEHLSAGTHADNAADAIAKGSHARMAPKGEANGNAVLTPWVVRQIRASTETNAGLARRLGVGINTIRGVRTGRTWSHIQ